MVASLRQPANSNLLVGFDADDDAAVYALREDVAIVQTADFITPIVDDPFTFGQIAATNALSDVYAMGGKPLTALNLCCFPSEGIEQEHLRAILEGGLSKIIEAKASLVGGHTVRDKELKYGLAVTGTIHPKDIKPNRGAKAGNLIYLTKPIGTGILTTAFKKGEIGTEVLQPAVRAMTTLNSSAAEAMVESGADAATDITGFGLVVHLLEVARASQVSIELDWSSIPIFDPVRELSKKGIKTGVTLSNEQSAFGEMSFHSSIMREDQLILFDPQTSGGLAIFIQEKEAKGLSRRLSDLGVEHWQIGKTLSGPPFCTVSPMAS